MATVFLTDIEGDLGRFEDFAAHAEGVSLREGQLDLRSDTHLVFGGDATDNGPGSIRILKALTGLRARLAARGEPERCILIAGNRDLNKIRLLTELDPANLPATRPTPTLQLKWVLANTMGAKAAFAYRAEELSLLGGRTVSDDEVTASFLSDLAPGGLLREYLRSAQLAFRKGNSLFLHGAVTDRNFLEVPGRPKCHSIDEWVDALNRWYHEQFSRFEATGRAPELIAYQTKAPGSHTNPASIVYGHYSDESANPVLPGAATLAALEKNGIHWVFSGHRPYGESPSVLNGGAVQFVLADNSQMAARKSSLVTLDEKGEELSIRGTARINGVGPSHEISFALKAGQPDPFIGKRTEDGFLVRGRTTDGRYLLARIRSDFSREEELRDESELRSRKLGTPSDRGRTD